MTRPLYDVLTIGNAIVDVLARVEESLLVEQSLVKGSMRLVDEAEAERLQALMPGAELVSGGCAGNTAAGVAAFGRRAAFIGKVADDPLGRFFRADMARLGIHFPTAPLEGGQPTARSMILITPDGERTMNTNLAACLGLTVEDIDRDTVEAAAVTYLEGYLWDPPKAKDAFRVAAKTAHGAGRSVAITLSDSFCVGRYRPEFIELMRGGAVDIVFANRAEILSLYETSDFDLALAALGRDVALAAVTVGADGSFVVRDGDAIHVPASPVDRVVDLTGAGDLYAAGFLAGYAAGESLGDCAALGTLAAAEVIGHVGARPAVSLAAPAAALLNSRGEADDLP